MARFNEILAPRFARGIQKLFGVKGRVPTPVLSSEIQVVHPLVSGAEHRYLEGWERHGVAIQQIGAAGATSSIRIRNPANSNIIAVLEFLSVIESLAESLGIIAQGATSLDLTTTYSLSNSRLDLRGRPQPILSFSSQAPASALGSNRIFYAMAANTVQPIILYENQELTLLPGDALQINSAALNVNLAISALWRERFLEEPERT